MYRYSQDNAAIYSKLGVQGTTYEPGFDATRTLLGDLTEKTVLDYGSGAGRTAQLLLGFGASSVVGVDHNVSMIDEARQKNIEGATFTLIEGAIPLVDNSVDAALSAHVLVEVPSRTQMNEIFGEVFRVLKPGGTFVLISNNENAIGANYRSFQYETPSELVSGQKIPITIKGETPFVIDDYFWLENDYLDEMQAVGFHSPTIEHPLATGDDWLDESKVAPHVVIAVYK